MRTTRDELVADAQQALMEFIHSRDRSRWVKMTIGQVYVRQGGSHNFWGSVSNCFDVANIQILPEYRGHGIFTEVMEWLAQAHNNQYTYVESILNQGFGAKLTRMGWLNAEHLCDYCLVKKNVALAQRESTMPKWVI